MYNDLAKIYDALVSDENATKQWVDFINAHSNAHNVLELACGSGEITLALAKEGKKLDACDLSAQMIEQAKAKDTNNLVNYFVMDLTKWDITKKYDTILCLCDSLNYVIDEEKVQAFFKDAYNTLEANGTLIFDIHSEDRLFEFAEEFLEEGQLNGIDYIWSIETIDDCLYQNFQFFQENQVRTLEQHIQRVYPIMDVKAWLEAVGFEVSIYSDFDVEGVKEAEKIFFVCKKKEV